MDTTCWISQRARNIRISSMACLPHWVRRSKRIRPPPSPRRSIGCAIRMDAIADLLLAESVHQVVQGNYARARGAVQALTDGEFPPLPDVIQTPRMGKSLTHRVALFLDPAATAGWNGTLTPRAASQRPTESLAHHRAATAGRHPVDGEGRRRRAAISLGPDARSGASRPRADERRARR